MPELLQTDPAIKNGVFEWPNCTSLTSKASPPDDRLWDLLIVLEDNGDPARTYVDETATWFACSETRASLSSSSSSKTTTLPFRLWSTSLPWISTNEKCQFEWFLEAQTMRLMQVMVRFSWSCLRSLSSPAGSSSSFRFHATARFSTCEVEWGKKQFAKRHLFYALNLFAPTRFNAWKPHCWGSRKDAKANQTTPPGYHQKLQLVHHSSTWLPQKQPHPGLLQGATLHQGVQMDPFVLQSTSKLCVFCAGSWHASI